MRLIDADALKMNMFGYAPPEMVWDRGDINHKIDEMPTIDAVPVVRCAECKYWARASARNWLGDPGCGTCCCDRCWGRDYDLVMTEDDFCSYGERKDETVRRATDD